MALVVQYLPPETLQADSIQPQSGTRRCLESHAQKSASKIQSHNNDNRMYLKSPSGSLEFQNVPLRSCRQFALTLGPFCCTFSYKPDLNHPENKWAYGWLIVFQIDLLMAIIALPFLNKPSDLMLKKMEIPSSFAVANPIIQPCVVKHSDCRSPPPAKIYEKNPWFLCPSLVPCYGPCLLGALLTMAFITLLRIPGRLGEERRWSTTKNTPPSH